MKLSASLDLELVALEQPDELALLVELTAPEPTWTAPRRPAAVQVVVDRSGSMAGERLDAARRALCALVDRLDPADRFGVVAFDDQAQVVVPCAPVTDRVAVKRRIEAVAAGGSTDLSAGYLRGLQEVQQVPSAGGAKLILLSDGRANSGVTDGARLGAVAEQARRHGVTTTTLGVGLGYDERLLAALARGGSGSELFAEEADTAVALIASEVEGLLEQVATAASLRVRLTPAVSAVAVLNDLPVQDVDDGVLVELGSFTAGETRKLVLRFRVPALRALGLAQIATLELVHVAMPDLVQHTTSLPVHVNVVPGDQAAGRIPDPVVRVEELLQRAQIEKRRSSSLLTEGQLGPATRLLRSTADRLAAEARELPRASAAELAEEESVLRGLAAEAETGSRERAAKSASADATLKGRLRGRGTTSGAVLLRRADGADSYLLEPGGLEMLRRYAARAGARLSRSRPTGPELARAIATYLDEADPLYGFLIGAGRHGGFSVE